MYDVTVSKWSHHYVASLKFHELKEKVFFRRQVCVYDSNIVKSM